MVSGNINDVTLQRDVISFILQEMGDEAYDAYPGSGERSRLESTLKEAKEKFLPTKNHSNFRRWWYHFVQYGDTPAQVRTRRYRSRALRYARRSLRGRWTGEHTRKLKLIVDSEDDLYLDEIQEKFLHNRTN
jgi:hypothetical protein